ncbi:NAD-dependent epimerase/dehydratase family protein [Polynucleobacter paneuropaeus]|nr:NAD-dependent epimerase/dehydratase family protein [Polynucleobacter paneuropaeus]
MNNSVLVTGGSGFLGKAFAESALAKGFKVRVTARRKSNELNNFPDLTIIPNLNSGAEWSSALLGVKTIVHCAAHVHVMRDQGRDSLNSFRKVNVEGTLNLAHQAVLAGVKRFIFISSIKVNGESTAPGEAFAESDIPNPVGDYAKSKYEAELGLRKIGSDTGLEIVIIRPPLVYGPGVKANFLSMINLLQQGFLIPLGGIVKNQRSFIFIENLVDMLITCVNHPAAANQLFLVSDDEDLSTTVLLERMALALGRPPRLIVVPAGLIKFIARLIGRSDLSKRLCDSLRVDISKAKDFLGWSPPVSVKEGLHQTAAYFLNSQS